MNKLIFLTILVLLISCSKNKEIEITVDDYNATLNKITEITVHDVFSPPVVSRVYAYTSLIGYEILAQEHPNYESFSGKLQGFKGIPKASTPKEINYKMASIIAMSEIGKQLVFSEKEMTTFQDSLYDRWKSDKKFVASKQYAENVVSEYKKWMKSDNYAQTRTMPKYTVDPNIDSLWQPTPPAYMAGIEPNWNKIRTWVMDSAAQFKPISQIKFSKQKGSLFYQLANEVMEVGNDIRSKGEKNNDQLNIAKFWDCNPYVLVQQGHMMFATKKITPGGHWINIAQIISKDRKSDIYKTAYVYARTSLVMADAFISCWDEKYRSKTIRPETYINRYMDENWKPILQTPPFPEYTSGHSVASGAIATVLTEIFGDNVSFTDTSEIPYGLPARKFNSIMQAAQEAAISRLYGGIHYMPAIEIGVKEGQNIGNYHNKKLKGIVR